MAVSKFVICPSIVIISFAAPFAIPSTVVIFWFASNSPSTVANNSFALSPTAPTNNELASRWVAVIVPSTIRFPPYIFLNAKSFMYKSRVHSDVLATSIKNEI